MPRIYDILTSPWSIEQNKLLEIQELYRVHFRGEKIDLKGIQALLGKPINQGEELVGYEVIDGVGIIPVEGPLTKVMDFWSYFMGGSSYQEIGKAFKGALNDPTVKSILFNVDSPGGTVDGVQELGNLIYESRGTKPIIGFSDGMVASAAYWLFSAMDARYVAGDTNQVGSIGVIASHMDWSRENEMMGLKVTNITAGKYKAITSPDAPLSKEGQQYIQDQVDYLYSVFVNTVSRNLGVSTEKVLNDMADGRLFFGQQAIDAGMVDGVSSMDRLIIKYGNETPASIRAMVAERVRICQEQVTKGGQINA